MYRNGIRDALANSFKGVYLPVRAALADGKPVPVGWYGQQDAGWIAYYDTLRRLGLAEYDGPAERRLDCLMVERPAVIRVEAIRAPGTTRYGWPAMGDRRCATGTGLRWVSRRAACGRHR